jgi:hypothetical protein
VRFILTGESMDAKTDWVAELRKIAPQFLAIPRADQILWRYVDFATFVSMLHEKALYFRRVDHFSDQHEAALSKPALERVMNEQRQRIRRMDTLISEPIEIADDVFDALIIDVQRQVWSRIRQSTFINCWHANTVESMAMWEIYSGKGIAIRSTAGQLIESTRGHTPAVLVGGVTYVDHGSDNVSETMPYLFKRKIYSYEQEVRAFFRVDTLTEVPSADLPTGESVPCDLAILIEEVRVAPQSRPWFKDALRSVLAKYELSAVPIHLSEADAFQDVFADPSF